MMDTLRRGRRRLRRDDKSSGAEVGLLCEDGNSLSFEEPSTHEDVQALNLLDACTSFDVAVIVALHLEAACLGRLACASCSEYARLDETIVRWCANRRREELVARLVPGDLSLACTSPLLAHDGDDAHAQNAQEGGDRNAGHVAHEAQPARCATPRWTLERLHLAENPPRFPRLYFHFASDELVVTSRCRVDDAVDIFRRFPGLVVRIEGYGNPSAPPSLGRAVAQARAAATRKMILRRLASKPGPRVAATKRWAGEDANEGVYEPGGYDEGRGRENTDFYRRRLIGHLLQAIGLWGRDPEVRNRNFQPEVGHEAWDPEAKFRRVDFTVLGLEDV